ncbi:killer cell lectin-like receptor subfamily G member 1 [Pithys albifrons albifrons]|uniref:killer cell lectin-like receptor subfamily G member 1 n=1 Tax=Pithys albifrons albifrons TaxID=3385563 RepID=UPI003A5CB804
MAQNVINADLNLPESATPRVQQVSDVSGKSCCSRPCVPVLITAIILALVIVVCRIIMYYPTASSQQQSTALFPSPEEALGCPPQWEIHGRKCYFFNPEKKKKDWNASRAECTAMGADLVIIDNKDELVYLMEQSEDTYYFLGLRYSVMEQKWKWINNVEHDPALFKIEHINFLKYLCPEIGYGRVSAAPCGGHPKTQILCEKAANTFRKHS